MSHGFNEARVKVAHPYLTMMGLYLGGFTGMFSETCLNIALPQLGVAFWRRYCHHAMARHWIHAGNRPCHAFCEHSYEVVFRSQAHAVFSWRVYRRFARERLRPHVRGAVVWATGARHGTGLVLPMMFSMVLEVFPPCKIGAAMGVTALIIMFAPAIGPTLSGILLGIFSWRAIFFSFVVVLAVGVALCFEIPREPL